MGPGNCVLVVKLLMACTGVRNNLQGLQAVMACLRAAVTWQGLGKRLL